MSELKGEFLYEGKAKRIFGVKGQDDLVWIEFKDDLTAFNAQKKGSFEGKGPLNFKITTLIFNILKEAGVDSHWVDNKSEKEMVCKKLKIIPLEVVVRNWLAGSTAKKFAIPEGTPLDKPIVEFFYKNDELQDPFLSDDQALMLKAAESQEELNDLKARALKVNSILKESFEKVGIRLIDFKLEFGKANDGKIYLADEITPDSCRLWDLESGEKLDKDRFRRDLGKVKESYEEIWDRLSKEYER